MNNQRSNTRLYQLVYGAVIAALYVVLTYVAAPISFGPVQVRISEALCMLAAFTPAAIPGLFVGCLLANALCGAVIVDVICGSIATLIGAIGTYKLRNTNIPALIPPIVANTIIVPMVLKYAYGSEDLIFYMMLTVGIGEVLSIGILGSILRAVLTRYKSIIFRQM